MCLSFYVFHVTTEYWIVVFGVEIVGELEPRATASRSIPNHSFYLDIQFFFYIHILGWFTHTYKTLNFVCDFRAK